MHDTTPDPRRRFEALLEPAAPPVGPTDHGGALVLGLLGPRVHAAYLPLARPWPQDPTAVIHETRVATRRLQEALALVAPALGGKAVARARERARKLRGALGVGREAEVMGGRLSELARKLSIDDHALGILDTVRAEGARASATAQTKWPPRRLLDHALDTLDLSARVRTDAPFSALGAAHLIRRAEAVLPFLATIEDRGHLDRHHRLRVRLKHVRYTIELLADPFNAHFDAPGLLGTLKELQDALGALSDSRDLDVWLTRRDVLSTVSEEKQMQVRLLADRELDEHYFAARDLVLKHVPGLLTEAHRVAAVIAQP